LVEWMHRGKPTALGLASGIVAGLVAVTPASGYVTLLGALVIGLLAGAICYVAVSLKPLCRYDDSLDAFGVHGAGGTLGAILTGIFATCAINPIFGNGAPTGAIDGHWSQILNQLAGIAIAWGISIAGTLILLFVVDKVIGLRVSPEHEHAGLDLSQHGEEGYDFNA
ncbi:MAG: ammonium transporter, partial [Acidobacteriota bacterium]|nr:ammonium transporter [Acidobacteriota bacterium]